MQGPNPDVSTFRGQALVRRHEAHHRLQIHHPSGSDQF